MTTHLRAAPRPRAGWLTALGFLVLSVIPIIGGALRLTQLAGGAAVTPENARFFAATAPVVLHIVSASLFAVLGAFQFVVALRRRSSNWHRSAGRYLTALGLIAGLSGLWMTLFLPPGPNDGALLFFFRLLFGLAMVACIALGFAAIRARDVARHGVWMTRGYAIGLGAGTQALVQVPFSFNGPPGELGRALLMGAGWTINLAVAEWAVRRQTPARSLLVAQGGVA